ncbi:M20/M25/M40 family metallo-hydrolase [Microbacterium luticocti]|uniref:M20/M25/M40 family metallo-hydrolase n=1 Tax=Microbacterium luticocti TaxID=451764 RepID=UPI00041E1D54|nr:M20/M25/M40 family metallo-hydrolase [Microbacterium luticocti]
MSDLRAHAAARCDRVVADALALIEVESPSADHAAVAASARAVAALIEARLGRAPETIVVDGVTHLRLTGGGATRILLLAHHDTVWPLRTLDTIPARVDDGMLRGPGSVDMKTGLVLGIHALDLLRSLEGDAALDGITLLVTGDEEVGSATSRELIEREARGARAALVLEAGGDRGELKVQRKGTSMYRISVHGRAAHAGLEPERGINAVVGLADVIGQVAALNDSEPGLTVVPAVVAGGTATNTVPAAAHVDVDVRAESADSQRRLDERIRRVAPTLAGATVTVTGGVNRLPLQEADAAALFALAERVSHAHGLPAPVPIRVGGASDGNFTAGVGTPTLDGLGAWGGGAHGDDEHAVVAGLGDRLALLVGLLQALRAEAAGRGEQVAVRDAGGVA